MVKTTKNTPKPSKTLPCNWPKKHQKQCLPRSIEIYQTIKRANLEGSRRKFVGFVNCIFQTIHANKYATLLRRSKYMLLIFYWSPKLQWHSQNWGNPINFHQQPTPIHFFCGEVLSSDFPPSCRHSTWHPPLPDSSSAPSRVQNGQATSLGASILLG